MNKLKKFLVSSLAVSIFLMSSLTVFTSALESSDFNFYAKNGTAKMTVDSNGYMVTDGNDFKLAEAKTMPVGDFTAQVECVASNGVVKDCINIRLSDATAFDGPAGYDATTGYGVLVETNGPGTPLYIYMDKWAGGAWLGYLVPEGKVDSNICDGEIMQGVSNDYSIIFNISVTGNIVKAKASIKGTQKVTEEAVFDLTNKFTGEATYNDIPAGGSIGLSTMRGVAGRVFYDFQVKDSSVPQPDENQDKNESVPEYHYYSTDGKAPMIKTDGFFVSDGESWKLVESTKKVSDEFSVKLEIKSTAGAVKDCVCIRTKTPSAFSTGGFDAITGYGVFVETAGPGRPLYIYMDKWANGSWLGYLAPVGKIDLNICDGEIMKGVANDYSLIFDVSVSGDIVKAKATVKGTSKVTEQAVFDLTQKFSGEATYTEIPEGGSVCFGTMRLSAGSLFGNEVIINKGEDTVDNETGKTEIPKTSQDITGIVFAMVLALISLGSLVICNVRRNEK